jgi:hypothetical protein
LFAALTAGSAEHWLSAVTGTSFIPSTPPLAFHSSKARRAPSLVDTPKVCTEPLNGASIATLSSPLKVGAAGAVVAAAAAGAAGAAVGAAAGAQDANSIAANTNTINAFFFIFSSPLEFYFECSLMLVIGFSNHLLL